MTLPVYIKKYKYNLILLGLVILSLCINFIRFYSQIGVSLIISPAPFVYTCVNCLLFAIPFFFIRKRYSFIFLYLFLVDAFLFSNVVYYQYYKNIIPVFAYAEIGNLGELRTSIRSVLSFSDFFYFLNTLIFFLIYLLFLKGKEHPFPLKHRILKPLAIILFSVLIFLSGIFASKLKNITLEQKLFALETDPVYYVSYFGILPVLTYQLWAYSFANNTPLTSTEKEQIDAFLNAYPSSFSGPETEKKKNLIYIFVESLDTWVLKFKGGEAVPFLKELAEQEDVIFIPHVLPQTNFGRSSDAQLLVNTGLYPTFNGIVCNRYSSQYYPSLAEALKTKNYHSMTIMGNRATFWNQQTMNLVYQIDELISSDQLVEDEMIGMGISDKSTFRQTLPILKKITDTGKNFYAQIITLSSHDGIDFADWETSLIFPSDYPQELIHYIKSMEYIDEALREFIEGLKKNGLYDESIIIITGDHESVDSQKVMEYSPELLTSMESNKTAFVPLYILNSGREYTHKPEQAIGQIDIYPTLLDVMQASDYYWKGLGNSVFSESSPRFAVNKFMEVIGDANQYAEEEIEHKKESWHISNIMICKKYFEALKNNN